MAAPELTVHPAPTFAAITPSDTVKLTQFARALYVGTTGDVTVQDIEQIAITTFKNVPAGQILPIQVSFVMATNTTASNIVALF